MSRAAQRVFEAWESKLIQQLGKRGYLEFMAEHHAEVIEALAPLAKVDSEGAKRLPRKPRKPRPRASRVKQPSPKPRPRKSNDKQPPKVTRRQRARIEANAEALRVLEASETYTERDLQTLKNYTGYGGLPSPHGLQPSGEYYTPEKLANAIGLAVAPLLPSLAANGTVTVLEPGAGTGRLIEAVNQHATTKLSWVAVEKSPVSAKILEALHPEVEVHSISIEQFIAEHGSEYQGKVRLVVANPPFYTRDLADEHDKDPAYREEQSFAYFLRRTLDLLPPGGLGVFVLPNTFLSWSTYRALRERVLERHELLSATRIDLRYFPGVSLGTDVVFFRRRRGDVAEFSADEQATIDGQYFIRRPDQSAVEENGVLQLHRVEVPKQPAPEPLRPLRRRQPPGPTIAAAASAFGRRLDDVRRKIAMRDPLAHGRWVELRRDVEGFRWSASNPNPWEWPELDQADEGVQFFLDAFTEEGEYSAWFALPPSRMQYRGSPDNLTDQAIWLHEQSNFLRFSELMELHSEVGGTLSEDAAREALAAAGWIFRGESIRPGATPSIPTPIEDVELSPRVGWVPLDLLSQWAAEVSGSKLELERRDGLIVPIGIAYDRLRDQVSDETRWLVGWLNFDGRYFRPLGPPPGSKRIGTKGEQWDSYWMERFRAWIRADAGRRQNLAEAYNRPPRNAAEAPTGPLHIPRWSGDLTLHDFQARAVRRFVDAQQGLLALGTGLGKTYIAAAVIASARFQGWARRPVVLAPKGLAWKWFDAFARVLPDYRVAVIGSELCRPSKKTPGARSRVDKPQERADKWEAFTNGRFDAVIVTPFAFGQTRLSTELVAEYKQSAPMRRLQMLGQTFEVEDGHADGFLWDKVVDLLIVDEAADYRKLFMPKSPPRYMGAGSTSARARQLHIRAFATRRRSPAGRGVGLLSATPAKNSPVELYNLLHTMNPRVWEQAGIHNHDQFIARYLEIETVPTLGPQLDVEDHPAVTEIKNAAELRGILHRFGDFKSTDEVTIRVPTPCMHIIEVELDSKQVVKTKQYKQALGKGANPLATLVKLGLVAVHHALDEGHTATSAEGVDPASPKFQAIADRITPTPDGGHIVFLENLIAHQWLRRVLIETGIQPERIAILNGQTAKGAATRTRIAQGFNRGDFDVVIVNRVAYEGIDLQVRTAGIHHGDIPWTPADFQQRNGRGWRFGNTRDSIQIYCYVARNSGDHHKLAVVNGKDSSWLQQLLNDKGNEIRNPIVDAYLDRDSLLQHLGDQNQSVDTNGVTADRDHARTVNRADRLVYRAAARFADARRGSGDPRVDCRRRQEGEALLSELQGIDRRVWPWAKWVAPVLQVEPLVPGNGAPPVYEGLGVVRGGEAFEFGRLGQVDGKQAIGIRSKGQARWSPATAEDVQALNIRPEHLPGNARPFPQDFTEVVKHASELATRIPTDGWQEVYRWHLAAEQFVTTVWPRLSRAILEQLKAETSDRRYPVLTNDATMQLRLSTGPEIGDSVLIAPHLAGWHIYVRKAQAGTYSARELNQTAAYWWGRQLERKVL